MYRHRSWGAHQPSTFEDNERFPTPLPYTTVEGIRDPQTLPAFLYNTHSTPSPYLQLATSVTATNTYSTSSFSSSLNPLLQYLPLSLSLSLSSSLYSCAESRPQSLPPIGLVQRQTTNSRRAYT